MVSIDGAGAVTPLVRWTDSYASVRGVAATGSAPGSLIYVTQSTGVRRLTVSALSPEAAGNQLLVSSGTSRGIALAGGLLHFANSTSQVSRLSAAQMAASASVSQGTALLGTSLGTGNMGPMALLPIQRPTFRQRRPVPASSAQ